VISSCPSVVVYSKEFQAEIVQSLDKAEDPVLNQLFPDFFNIDGQLKELKNYQIEILKTMK
jgi:hypothetical protein